VVVSGNGSGFARIDALWAWISTDPGDEEEGLIGYRTPDGWWMPLVGADRERIESYRWHAELVKAATGQPVKLVRFSERTDIEVIE